MRIAHVSDSFPPIMGGIEAQVKGLATAQADAGEEVHVLTTTPARRGARGISAETFGAVTVHRIAARIPGGFPIHPRAGRHVAAVLARLRPDVVHLHLGILAPTAQVSLRRVVRAGLPAVVTVHSVWGKAERIFALLDRLVHWSGLPVVWTGVSELAAAPLQRIAGPSGTVRVVSNGVELRDWTAVAQARTDRGPTPSLHAVTATRFARRKRILPLLRTLRDVAGQARPGALRVTIAGEGEQLPAARRFVAAHGLADVIELTGKLTPAQLQELYADADVFLAPAVEESFGIAAAEAQAAGLAVLTRAGSGVAERVRDGQEGVVAVDDAAMAHTLLSWLRDAEPLRRIQAYNRANPPAVGWSDVRENIRRTYDLARGLLADGAGGRR